MIPVKIEIHYPDGSKWVTEDSNEIRTIGKSLPKVAWKKTANIAALRAKYHVMLRTLAKETNSGYTDTDLHEAIKPLIMAKFLDFDQYFTTGKPEYSTRNLNYEGWLAMLEQLKVSAHDVYGYTFK